MKRGVDEAPLFVGDGAAQQTFVKETHRTGVVVPIVIAVDRARTELGKRYVDGIYDDVQVVDKRAIPVPDHMAHRSGR